MQGLPPAESLIVDADELAFCVLNLYPYNSGHLLVLPRRHIADITDLDAGETQSIERLTMRSIRALRAEYSPDGFNLGMNLGSAAGAGIPGHLHRHILPRWTGDTNFITVIGAAKVMPEDLDKTWERLSKRLAATPA